MTCDAARRVLSDRLDDPVTDDAQLEEHLADCRGCRTFADRLEAVRGRLHLTPAEQPPDVAPSVRAALEGRRPGLRRRARRWMVPQAAAVFVAAFALAAAVVGLPGPPEAEATDVSALVLAGQTQLRSLVADVSLLEHGWHPEIATRRYTGRLQYLAPETMSLELVDGTDYPAGAWPPNDVTLAIDGPTAWHQGLEPCPPASLPGCIPPQPRTRVTTGREPFDAVEVVPLDLVLPVSSFVVAGDEHPLGTRRLDDHEAVGIEVPAAQIAPLLDGLSRAGNWRPVHPTDRAQVWLEAELGIPLQVDIRVTAGFERDRWAAASGLDEVDGDPILSWQLRDLRLNTDEPVRLPPVPAGTTPVDDGFRDSGTSEPAPDGLPLPGWLPEGMTLHRAGRLGGVDVASWSDGRAWVKIRATDGWKGGRLFGQRAGVVRRVELDDAAVASRDGFEQTDEGGAGVAYLAEGGNRVLVHGPSMDVEVAGSVPSEELLRIAASLGLRGQPVPDDWVEAATATLDDARVAVPPLLTAPPTLEGFAGPSVLVTERGVVQSFVGGGARAFVLAQQQGGRLGPPLDAVVFAVEVRGHQGRYTPARGTLAWIEDGHAVTLRSDTLSLAELHAIATALEAP